MLFYDHSGTGKSFTTAVLGKILHKEVYIVDLSKFDSKYIGETEKKQDSIFLQAETKDWILLFDEADALFGKCTDIQDSHNRYANQEVGYLLQKIENYKGLVIMITNQKNNLDDAFLRRFHALIHFHLPNAAERLNLWQRFMLLNFPDNASINLKEISTKYVLSGAGILNAVKYATLKSDAAKSPSIT